MDYEQGKWSSPLLTPDDKEFLVSVKQDYEKSRWLRLSGVASILLGIGIALSPYVSDATDAYLMVGIFFACLGLLTLRDTARTQRLYEILKKFMPSNMEL